MTSYATLRWMWASCHILISWISLPPHSARRLRALFLCPSRIRSPSLFSHFTLGSGLRYFVSLVTRILRFGRSFNFMKVARCFHFFSSTLGQRKTNVSGFKSLINSFIHRPACWREVRENKLSHRVLFKLSDPFQHALPASLFVCVWGAEGRRKKKILMAKSPQSIGIRPRQPSSPPFMGTGVCQSVPHTHTLPTQHKQGLPCQGQQNDFPTTLHTSATLPKVWHLVLSPHSLPSLPPHPPCLQQAGQVPVFKSPFPTPFCLETLSLDLILLTLPCQKEDAEVFSSWQDVLKSSTSPTSFKKGHCTLYNRCGPLRNAEWGRA